MTPSDRAEGAPADTGLRFKAVIDAFGDPLLIVDHHGIVRYANAAVSNALGHRLQDVLARPFRALLHPDERERIDAQLAGRESPDSVLSVEHRIQRADGAYELAET